MIPPTSKETLDDPGKTLSWIKAQVSRLYSTESTSPGKESVPLDRATYLHLYTAIHDYGVIAMHPGRPHIGNPHAGQALYDFLQATIATHCASVRSHIRESQTPLEMYVAQWKVYEEVSGKVANVFRTFDRHWVRRERDERRPEVERWRTARRKGRDGGVRPLVGVLWEVRVLHWRVWRGVVLGVWEEGDCEGEVEGGEGRGDGVGGRIGEALWGMKVSRRERREGGDSENRSGEGGEVVEDVLKSFETLGIRLEEDGRLVVSRNPGDAED